MAFSDNNPTFKYVKISGLNIIHEGISYRISEIYSSSKYFYWDKNKSPNELITSNIRIAESASVFLICMNDRGIHTEVNHDELIYNFGGYTSGGGGGDVSKTEFNALKVQVGENKEAYMNVSQSVEGINQVIGDTEELKDGTIIKHINSLKHTSDSMDLKIQELNTKVSDEYEELRDRCSDSLVDLLASISTLKIDFEHFAEEDEELTEEGKNTINTCIENTRGKLSTLKGIVEEILTILSDGERLDEHTDLNSAFNDMSTDVTNMLNLVSRSISDDGISSDDIINVILAIGTATQKLSVLKATVDEIMTLGLGGTIYDSYSQIHVDNERIKTTVKKTESIIYGALKSSSSEYYSSTSTTALEGGGWQDTPPEWQAGRYIWQRTKYTYASGQVSYSTPVCIAGAKGDRGEDGTSTKILGSYDTYEELIQAHPLDNESGDGYLIKGELYVWTGTQFENVGQIKGDDGESAHLHIKYSNDGGQTFTGNNGEDTGLYIGIYSDFSVTDSSDVNDYKWSLIKGEDGKDGLNGIDGINGKDGVSIIWKGTLTEHPSGAENGWAYYNSTEGKSFVYQDETWYQMSIDGTDGIQGNDGADGLSIVWKGEQKTPPSRPETNWVYRDTDNGIVYIYNGSAWEAMTYDGSDGVDGTNGTDGLSIVWKGESSEPPSNAEENWVYRDTDDGIIYIYTEGEWVIMAVDGIDGVDGKNGINGSSLLIFTTDYSANQSTIEVWSKEGYKRNWVVKEDITNVQAGDNALIKVNNSTRGFDCFILVKVNSVNVNTSSINATSYGLVDKGEDGADGLSVFITYHDSVEKPSLPTGDGTTNGWHTDTTDDTRWMSQKVALSASEGTWGEPIKIKGEDGSSLKILGTYNSLEELLAKHPIGTNKDGDGYLINGELYVWSDDEFLNVGRIKGEDGEDGTSMYFHVKYSNDGGLTFTANNGETEGIYIGTYADREEMDSTDVTKYKWVKLKGQSLVKSTPEWYLSTSKTNQTGGSWSTTIPELKDGYYLWLRYKLEWENPTQTTYSTPTVERIYENVKEIAEKQATLEQDINGFKTTVSKTYATKDELTGLESGYVTKTEYEQTANKFNWIVESGTSQSNMTLTDKMYSLISDNITLSADKINLNGYVNANETFQVDTDGNVMLGDPMESAIYLYADGGSIMCYDSLIERSCIQNGRFYFKNNRGAKVGNVGASYWSNDTSKWLTAVNAEYGNTVGLGAKYSSSDSVYTCSTIISSIGQLLGSYYYHQGTNINNGHFTNGLNIHSQRSSDESNCAFIEGTQISGSGLRVYGNNYGLALGVRNNANLKLCLRYTLDSSQLNGVYGNAYAPINMNNYKIYNSSISSTSDRTLKENIKYLDYNNINSKARTIENDDITLDDMYNFINNDYMLANYNYIGEEEKTISAIAQDLLVNMDGTDNKVGQLITHRCKKTEDDGKGTIIETDSENGKTIEQAEMVESETVAINQTELLNITIGAFQKACEKIESLERQIQQLQDIINGEE